MKKIYQKLVSRPSFVLQKVFNEKSLTGRIIKEVLKLIKTGSVGLCILDLNKIYC